MNLGVFFRNLFASIATYLKSQTPIVMPKPESPPPTLPPTIGGVQPMPLTATLEQKLEILIAHENGAEGPFSTGGYIHAIDAATRALVARTIVSTAHGDITATWLAAWIRSESNFDPGAYNPNVKQTILDRPTPGYKSKMTKTIVNAEGKSVEETLEQAFYHTDWGIAQYDGKTLAKFADLGGMTWEAMRDTALDPTWAVPAMVDTCLALMVWAQGVHTKRTNSGQPTPWGADYRVLACEAYNAGVTGAVVVGRDYTYGQEIVTRATTKYRTALGEP